MNTVFGKKHRLVLAELEAVIEQAKVDKEALTFDSTMTLTKALARASEDGRLTLQQVREEKERHIANLERELLSLRLLLARKEGEMDALHSHVSGTELRLQNIEKYHIWHIGGAALAHNGEKQLLYECACGTSVVAPPDFFDIGVATNG